MALDCRGNLLICGHEDCHLDALPPSRKNGELTLTANHQGPCYKSPNNLVASTKSTLYFTDPPLGLP